jgi:hypothetical protein
MAIIAATILIAAAVVGAGIAGGRLFAADRTIVVDQSGGGTVTTITEAVTMAQDGDPRSRQARHLRRVDHHHERHRAPRRRPTASSSSQQDTPTYDGFWWDPAPFSLLLLDSDAVISDLTFGGAPIVAKGGAHPSTTSP